MLLKRIGKGVEVHEIDDRLLAKSVAVLREASRRVRSTNYAARRTT